MKIALMRLVCKRLGGAEGSDFSVTAGHTHKICARHCLLILSTNRLRMDVLSIAKGLRNVCNQVFLNVCFVSCRRGIGTIESGLTSMRDHRRLIHNSKHL